MEENRYFQQLTVYDNFTLVDQLGQLEQIDYTSGDVEIKSAILLNTIKAKSYEGQHLSGKELFITGILQTTVYFSCSGCGSLHKTNYHIPFSTYIIVPTNLRRISMNQLVCSATELSAIMIMPRQIFVNGVILIEYIGGV